MPIKTKTHLIECKQTHSDFREAKALQKDSLGRPRYRVVLLTEGKGNPRDKHYYSQACVEDPVTAMAFEGKPCFLNHPSLIEDQSQPERRVQDKGGWFDNVCVEGSALMADLTINRRPAGELLEAIILDCLDYAKTHPGEDSDGLSINANGESQPIEMDGETWNQVDRITEAESVDAVTKAARGGRFLAKIEAMRKKQVEVDVQAPEKLKQIGDILKSMRDKIQTAEEGFPQQSELRRQVDNALTLAGCGEPEGEPMITEAQYQTMKKTCSLYEAEKAKAKVKEGSSSDNKIARKHTHDTLSGMAAQVPDEATKSLLMAHAAKYKDEGDGEGGEAKGEEAGAGMPGAMPDTTESEKESKKKEKMKKEKDKKEKSEGEGEGEKEGEADDDKEEGEKMESLRRENFDLKLNTKLAESGLPEQSWKMIRSMVKGKTIEEVDEVIEAQQELFEYSLRESSMPARQPRGNGNSGSPVLAGDSHFN